MIDIEIIMNNTYGVLTNRCSVEDILDQYEGTDAMFYGNPYNIECSDIDEVINFYENTEEYEKCSELLSVKNDIIAEKLTKKLMRDALYRTKR
jgi:hypothetical protein|tara:strand:+ start:357 stop:635 length:279 start_codon:yes stop_codon:yes gene_type:complete